MSYTKDPDRYTRGPNAIAAMDNRRNYARRVAVARASAVRDRALSQFTYGPQGGLGRVKEDREDTNQLPQGPGGSGVKNPTPKRPTYRRPTQLPPGWLPPRPSPTPTGPRGPIADPVPPPPPPGTGYPTGGGPKPAPTTGGGGGGGGSPLPTTPPPTVPTMEPPDMGPVIPDGEVATAGVDYKKLAIIGGVIAGAYFLFFRNKSSGGTP